MRYLISALALCLFSFAATAYDDEVPPPRDLASHDVSVPPPAIKADWQEEDEDFVAPQSPLVEHKGGFTYASGGVGEEELAALKALGDEFSLRVLTKRKDGAFIGTYNLRVLDEKGEKLFEATGKGPWFFAKLAPGKYIIEEQAKDFPAQQKKTSIPITGHRELEFSW